MWDRDPGRAAELACLERIQSRLEDVVVLLGAVLVLLVILALLVLF